VTKLDSGTTTQYPDGSDS